MIAGHSGMQQPIGWWRGLSRCGRGRCAGECDRQPHRIHGRESARQRIIARDECGAVLRRTEILLQLVRGIVIEPQIGRGEPFFQNTLLGEQTQRGTLPAVGRTHQHFSLALEVGAGDPAVDALRKRDGPVVEPQVNIFPIDGRFADFVDALGIESDAAQGTIERQYGAGRQRQRLRLQKSGAQECSRNAESANRGSGMRRNVINAIHGLVYTGHQSKPTV